jgi:hypothetical protein
MHWQNHFADKRAEGEWFNLSTEDVMEFCCHTQMEVSDVGVSIENSL